MLIMQQRHAGPSIAAYGMVNGAAKRQREGERMPEVVIVIGPGQIGQAIARRVGVGKHVLLADHRGECKRGGRDSRQCRL